MGIASIRWLCPLLVDCITLHCWNFIEKQSNHNSNRSIGNPIEAKSQGAFIGSMRYCYPLECVGCRDSRQSPHRTLC